MARPSEKQVFLLLKEFWWGSWILAGLAVLVGGVAACRSGSTLGMDGADFKYQAVPAAQALLAALAGATPALALGVMRLRGRVRFEYGARPPRYHGLAFPRRAEAARLRRMTDPHDPPSEAGVQDYHVFAAAGAVLLCLAPAVPFLSEFFFGPDHYVRTVPANVWLAATYRVAGTWTAVPALAVGSLGVFLGLTAAARFLRRLNEDA